MATVDRVVTNVLDTVTVRARIEGAEFGYVLLSTTAGQSRGTIQVPGSDQLFHILSDPAAGSDYLLELDPARVDKLEGGASLLPPAVRDEPLLRDPLADPLDRSRST